MAAGINIASKTSNSVTLYLSGLDTSWANGIRTVYWYLGRGNSGMIPSTNNPFQSDVSELENAVSSGGHITFYGLEPNTEYGIYCEIYHGSTFLKDLTGWVTTPGEEATVGKWSWFSSNGSATAVQTEKAYDAVRNQEPTKNFSYKVWNDMVDKVKAILDADDGEWDTKQGKFLSYEETRMTEEDRRLTASRFNSLRYNVGYLYGEVKPGDPVRGTYFIEITASINNWIDSL